MVKFKKAYGALMWLSCLAAVVAAIMILQMPLKRAIQGKTMALTDYLFWRQYDSAPQQHFQDTNFRSYANSNQQRRVVQLETKDGKIKTALNPEENNQTNQQVSASVGQGSESLLKLYDVRPDK